jgi:transposase
MMGTQSSDRQPPLFSYRIDLEHRLGPDHLLRKVCATLDLSFVIPAVRHHYGRSGNVSLDPRVIVKLLLLLFLYDVPSERELMEQVRARLDFLWFLGFDLDTDIPHHSVLSKARARWGTQVFERLFVQSVSQCVEAGLVNGRLLHVDSTMVKAHAHKDTIVPSGPELVGALRQAYQEQAAKLQVLPADPKESVATEVALTPALEPSSATASVAQWVPALAPVAMEPPAAPPMAQTQAGQPTQNATAATTPSLRVLPPPAADHGADRDPAVIDSKPTAKKLPTNCTRVSTTDPEAELARSKNGLIDLNYKDHRLVDDTHGVITAVAATTANVADGTEFPALYEQHRGTTGLKPAQVTVAGDHHYGTAHNYIFCAQQGLRAHLGEVSANVEERGKLPPSQFVYEPAQDRLRCRQGHYLVCHQDRPEEQLKVYLIEDPATCARCALRKQCTQSKRGRSIRRHVQAPLVEAARTEANSPAARCSRKRRQHVMEGSFADAVNNHGAKKARWRGLWRQKIQSWLIAAVQNLRILLRHRVTGPVRVAVAALARAANGARILKEVGRITGIRVLWGGSWLPFAGLNPSPRLALQYRPWRLLPSASLHSEKGGLGNTPISRRTILPETKSAPTDVGGYNF